MNALLIVHGIGEQRRGETTEKLIVGLKAAYGGAVKVEHHPEGYPATVTANGHTVRLYEVHWADILSAQKSRGTFAWRVPNTVVWHPMWCHRLGLLPATEYSPALVWWRVASLVPLVPVGYLAYLGVRFFSRIFDKTRREAFEKNIREQKLSFGERSRAYADFTSTRSHTYRRDSRFGGRRCSELHAIDRRGRRSGIRDTPALSHADGARAAGRLRRVLHPGPQPRHGDRVSVERISVKPQVSPHTPRTVFTIGSPLEKIRFFWPWTVRTVPSLHTDFQWVNFHHRADRVSGYLKRFAAFATLQNVRLKGRRRSAALTCGLRAVARVPELLKRRSSVRRPHHNWGDWRGRRTVCSRGPKISGPCGPDRDDGCRLGIRRGHGLAAGVPRRVAISVGWRRDDGPVGAERARLVHVVRTDDGDAGAGVGPLQGCETGLRACVSARGRH